MLQWVQSDDFDHLLKSTVVKTYPAHEHDYFMAHFGGLLSAWVKDEKVRLGGLTS